LGKYWNRSLFTMPVDEEDVVLVQHVPEALKPPTLPAPQTSIGAAAAVPAVQVQA
jgi:hypothetical protein